MSKTIAFTNQKGGVGKSTTTVNLAACLAEAEQKVLLIDFDPQGNASSGLGVEAEKDSANVYDLICGNAGFEDCVIRDLYDNLDILPSDIELSGAELEFQDLPDRYEKLKQSVSGVTEMYDYILIDCPPSLGVLTINALNASDSAIIPVQCEYYALEGLKQVLNTVHLVSRKMNQKLKVEGILFTMYDQRTKLSEQVVETVKANLRESVFRTLIPRNVKLAEAPSFGQPITVYDSASRGAESYRLLAAEILDRS